MQRSTLSSIVARLPRILVNRYAGAGDKFWIDRANTLLGKLERLSAGPNSTTLFPMPWELCQGGVVLPPQLVDVTRAFRSVPGENRPQLRICPAEGGFRIDEEIPSASTFVSSGQIESGTEINGRTLFGGSYANVLPGDGCLTYRDYVAQNPFVASQQPLMGFAINNIFKLTQVGGGGTVNFIALPYQHGEYDWYDAVLPLTTTPWRYIFRDFLVIEGHRAYKRVAAMTDLCPLPPAWDHLVEAWLRFIGEQQTDQSSPEASLWEKFWTVNGAEWTRFHSQVVSSFKERGLKMPISMASRR